MKANIIASPKDVLVGKIGHVVMVDLEVQNGFEHPWKQGASIQSILPAETIQTIDEVVLPIDWAVAENTKFKVSVPIKIKDSAKGGDKVYHLDLQFIGAKGNPFGPKIPIKIQVEKIIDEIEYF